MSANTEHKVLIAPDDPHISIWRYMDFTKFVSMLENKGLYFSRSDKLGDPFEGSFSKGNEKLRQVVYDGKIPTNILNDLCILYQRIRMWTFVNCWHMNKYESAAMWKLYSKTNEAIAIKSSYQQLKECLDDVCFLGMVQYIDYESAWSPEGNLLYPYIHKRLSFSHEQELRAFIQKPPIIDGKIDLSQDPPAGGVWKPVEIDKLVNEIYVAPMSPPRFRKLVEQILKRYMISKPVIQSSLDNKPFF